MEPTEVRRVLEPEARLLLSATTTDPSRAALPELLDELDDAGRWKELFRMAVRERALGPLWGALAPVRDRLPADFRDNLERAATLERLRQLRLERRLRESVGALHSGGITPVLLKGAALVHTLYDDVRDRPMADIDLLVGAEDVERAWSALRSAGWSWSRERFPREMYDRHYHLPPLVDADGTGIGLEVHEGLFVPGHPMDFGPDDLRGRAEEIEVGGHPALFPHPVDHLVYVCLHFAWSHALGSGGWRTFRDVERLVRADRFRWADFAHVATERRGEASAYWTLRLSRDLAGGEAPAGVLEELRPPLAEGVLGRLSRHYALELFPAGASCPSVKIRHLLWILGNSWGRITPDSLLGRRTARPWDYSADFRPLGPRDEVPDRGIGKIRRHLTDAGTWREYLRRVGRPARGAG